MHPAMDPKVYRSRDCPDDNDNDTRTLASARDHSGPGHFRIVRETHR